MKFGVALLRFDGGAGELGVLAALDSLGVKVGAISGVGINAVGAMLYASGTDALSACKTVTDLSPHKSLRDILFRSKARGRKRLIAELERARVKRLCDMRIPVYLMVADKDGQITVITSDKGFISGSYGKKCELSAVSAADLILQCSKNRVERGINFKNPLEMQNIDAIISISGEERKSGRTDYGYNLSLGKSTAFKTAYDGVISENEEMLKSIFLR